MKEGERMFHSRLWKTSEAVDSLSQACADPRLHQRLRRRPWIYGMGALIPLLISLLAFTPAFADGFVWTNWFQVPANTPTHTLLTASTPAVVEYDTGKVAPGCTPGSDIFCTNEIVQYIFARQSNNTIDLSTHDFGANTPTSAPTEVPPGGGLTPSAPTAVQLGSTLYVFVQGTENHVWVNKFNGTSWSNWHQVFTSNGSLIPTANGPFVTVYQGSLFLFVRNPSDGSIDVTRSSDGNTWTNLSEVPSGGHTPSTPTAAVFGSSLYVMVQGPDNFVWVNTFDGVIWSNWKHVVTQSGALVPTTTSPALGGSNFRLIVRLSDGSIDESITSDGITWGTLQEVVKGGHTPSAPTIATVPPSGGGLDLFVQGPDNTVWENDLKFVFTR
jgi:hypothetical protein